MSVFVDTSALYAILDRDDAAHARATARWRDLVERRAALVTSSYVVVESCAVVQHRLGAQASRTLLEDLLGVAAIEWVTPDEHARAVSACLAAGRRKLSLVDCASFEVMRRLGLRRVLAFDAHFAEAGLEPA